MNDHIGFKKRIERKKNDRIAGNIRMEMKKKMNM